MAGIGKAHLRDKKDALLQVENLVVEYKSPGGGSVQAVSDVSLDIVAGETVAVVGE